MKKSLKKGFLGMLTSVLFVIVFGYIGAAVFMYSMQDKYIYHTSEDKKETILPFEEITFHTDDGLELYSWYTKPKNGRPTIIYFHGNASTVQDAAYAIMPVVKEGYGALLVEYRGYAGNPGTPSENNFYIDAAAAYDWLVENKNPGKIVIYGMSLGTGVASYLATQKPNDGLILESSFSSMEKLASDMYWYLPVKLLLRDKYLTIKRAGQLTSPVLIVHGEKDRLISIDHPTAVYEKIHAPKEMVRIENGAHADLPYNGLNNIVIRWLNNLDSVKEK